MMIGKVKLAKLTILIVLMALALVVPLGLGAQPVSAQEIPQGATIDSATFSIYLMYNRGIDTIYVHRITDPWDETTVTWNNFGGYDPTPVGSFVTDHGVGWYSVDVTALVKDWQDGTYPNYGLLLKQDTGLFKSYYSSEYNTIKELRPKLEINYTVGSTPYTLTIQRPGVEQDGVADAKITEAGELGPDGNYGSLWYVSTSAACSAHKAKLALIKFIITFDHECPGTGTPGYWKNHPEAWPVNEITIGGVTYTKEEAIGIMWEKKNNDKTYTMFAALVSAKLNVLIGNPSGCVDDAIEDADDWMATYGPAGSGVPAGGPDSPWRQGESLYKTLDDYNNGLLCAPPRD